MPRTRTIFIKDLNLETTDRMLASYFHRFGAIHRGGIFRDKGGPSRGCAFITFMEAESVDAVIATQKHQLDKSTTIRCQRVFVSNYRRIMLARQIQNEPEHKKKLFVARIPRDTTREELRDYFYEEAGAVLQVQFISKRTNKSTLYAFVSFAKASTVDIVQMTRPHAINNKTIFTRRVFPDQCSAEERKKTNILYALNYGENIEKSDLLEYFEDYGSIKSCDNSEGNHNNGYMTFEFEDFDVVDQLCLESEHHLKAGVSFTVQKFKPSPNNMPKEILSSTSEDTGESDKQVVVPEAAIPFYVDPAMRYIKFIDEDDDLKENKKPNLNIARLRNMTISDCEKINQREKLQSVYMPNTSNEHEMRRPTSYKSSIVNAPWSINSSSIYRDVAMDQNNAIKLKKDKHPASKLTLQRNSNERRPTSSYFKLPVIKRSQPYLPRVFRWGKKPKEKNNDSIQVQQSEATVQLNQPGTSKASVALLRQTMETEPAQSLQNHQNTSINPDTQNSINHSWSDSPSASVSLLNHSIPNNPFINVLTDELESLNLRTKNRELSKNQSVGERSCIWGGVVNFFNCK